MKEKISNYQSYTVEEQNEPDDIVTYYILNKKTNSTYTFDIEKDGAECIKLDEINENEILVFLPTYPSEMIHVSFSKKGLKEIRQINDDIICIDMVSYKDCSDIITYKLNNKTLKTKKIKSENQDRNVKLIGNFELKYLLNPEEYKKYIHLEPNKQYETRFSITIRQKILDNLYRQYENEKSKKKVLS